MLSKKRISILLSILMIFSLISNSFVYADSVSNKDYANHWAKDKIESAIGRGYVSGYQDGTYRPNIKITRAEFISMFNRAFSYTEEGDIDFEDVSLKDWYRKDVAIAYKQGYIRGVTNKKFAPKDLLTREQAATIVAKTQKLSLNNNDKSFSDIEKASTWSREYIKASYAAGYISGDKDGRFRPKDSITRAEAVTIIENILSKAKTSIPKTEKKENKDRDKDREDASKKGSSSSSSNGSNTNEKSKLVAKQDGDKDGFSDEIEKLIGTDPNKSDTDGDGLTDIEEFYISNPLVKDSDKDFDGDGLSNYDEIKVYKTSAMFKDTDFDELSDYEEVITHKTNPNQLDTDEDGLSDSQEIKIGLNPLIANSKDEKISKNFMLEEKNGIKLNLDIDTNIGAYTDITVRELSNSFDSNILNSVGYMAGYEINANDFTDAKMKFSYDVPSGKTLGTDFIPALYYYNEKTKELEKVDGAVLDIASKTLTYAPTHFSIYVLLNEYEVKIAEELHKEHIKNHTYSSKPLDVVLVMDSSGSMYDNDGMNLRLQASKDLIDTLGDNDSVAVVDFDNSSRIIQTLTKDKELAKSAIDTIDRSGGTNIRNGIQDAFVAITKDSMPTVTTHDTLFVVFTDGQDNEYVPSSDYDDLIQKAQSLDIKIFTMGLGDKNSIDEGLLKKIADGTGGKYYHIKSAEDIRNVYDNNLKKDIVVDSDGDGLSDIEETSVEINKGYYTSNPNKADTDDDGLNDFEERKLGTNPNKKDTDGDGIADSKDVHPLKYDITDYTLALGASLSYNNLEDYIGKNLYNSNVAADKYISIADWKIIGANNSGKSNKFWSEFFIDKFKDILDGGFGYVAISNGEDIIYSLRGTDFHLGTQAISDGLTDLMAGILNSNPQDRFAFSSYRNICAKYPSSNYFISGHSLGGRLAQDTTKEVIKSKRTGFFGLKQADKITIIPRHTATFNGLGYNKISNYVEGLFTDKEDRELANNLITNHYIMFDEVGHYLGNSKLYERYGENKEYRIGDFLHTPIKYHDLDLFINAGEISEKLKNIYR